MNMTPRLYRIRMPYLLISLDHVVAIGEARNPARNRPHGVWMIGRDVHNQEENFAISNEDYEGLVEALGVIPG